MAQARVEYVSIDAQIEQLGGPKAAYERAEALRREAEKAAGLAKALEPEGKALQDQRSAAQHDYIRMRR